MTGPTPVVLATIARSPSAITIRKLQGGKRVYYSQALEHRRHTRGHTARLRGDRGPGLGGLLLLGLRVGA